MVSVARNQTRDCLLRIAVTRAGYCSDHRAATLSLVRHDGDDLTLTPSELDGRATSALDHPDTHEVRRQHSAS